MKVTADTITDEQIRELLSTLIDNHERHYLARYACAIALMHNRPEKADKIRDARARCAEILNARAKDGAS
jgi:hypothetical protein